MRKIFLWGERQKEDLIERNANTELQKKYTLIGNPGFDLCFPNLLPFNRQLKPADIPESYILVNTNFGSINSYGINEHLRACPAISPLSRGMMEEGYKKEEKQWLVFRSWLEGIIAAFPDEQFLIRPHPTELQGYYEKYFGKYKNVMISKKGNVNYITASAKIILHKDCSTAMQGYLMGVPSISLGEDALYETYEQWPLNFSFLPKTLEEAKDLIKEMLKGGMDKAVWEELDKKAKVTLRRNFSNLGNSTQALVETIVQDSQDLLKNFTSYPIIDSRTFIQKTKLFIRKRLWLHYKVPKASRLTLIKFTKKDIMKRLTLLEWVDPVGGEYRVRKLFPNAFQISKVHPS